MFCRFLPTALSPQFTGYGYLAGEPELTGAITAASVAELANQLSPLVHHKDHLPYRGTGMRGMRMLSPQGNRGEITNMGPPNGSIESVVG
jgi:hypothetical protein